MLASFAAQLVERRGAAGAGDAGAGHRPVRHGAERGVLPPAGHRRLPGPAAGPGRGPAGGRAGAAGPAAGLAAARPGGVGHPGADHPCAAAAAVQPARAVRPGAAAAGPGAGRGRGGPGGRGLRRAAGRDARGPPGAGAGRRRGWCCTASAGWASPPWPRRCCGPWARTPGWWSPRPGRSRWTTCSARSGRALHLAASAAEGGDRLARAAL